MRIDAMDEPLEMMMDLISAANDISILFGICDYLGKIHEIDVESQRNTASVVLPPRTPRSVSTVRSRKFRKLCFYSRGERLSKNIVF